MKRMFQIAALGLAGLLGTAALAPAQYRTDGYGRQQYIQPYNQNQYDRSYRGNQYFANRRDYYRNSYRWSDSFRGRDRFVRQDYYRRDWRNGLRRGGPDCFLPRR